MAPQTHPAAIIDSSAKIADDVTIGAYALIGANVSIDAGSVIGSHTVIDNSVIGKNCFVGAHCVLGGDPQVHGWESLDSSIHIADNVTINELCVIHRSMYEGGATRIGVESYIMAQTHIGHDCVLGKGVTLTTLAGLSGHVHIDDYAVIGGSAGVHQFVRVGKMAMVAGMIKLVQDLPPYFLAEGSPPTSRGLNSYALKKYSVHRDERTALKRAFRILKSHLPVPVAVSRIENELGDEGAVGELLSFIQKSERGLTL